MTAKAQVTKKKKKKGLSQNLKLLCFKITIMDNESYGSLHSYFILAIG